MRPLVKKPGAAVIGLPQDEAGTPATAEGRLAVASKIIARAEKLGIPREDVIIDCLACTLSADSGAGAITTGSIRRIKEELGVNLTLGASNVSFGLPDRDLLNGIFVAIAIASGVTCLIVDTAKVYPIVTAADLIAGRDSYGMRYIRAFRQRQQPT